MYLELHIIQSFGPSNLNRDDLNNPKESLFGGVRRARISSQCIKRAVREHPLFKQTTGVDNGISTRWIANLLRPPLLATGKPEAEVDAAVIAFAKAYVGKMDSQNKDKTAVRVSISPAEVNDAVTMLLDQWKKSGPSDKAISEIVDTLIKKYEKITSAPDIALFGRMLAEKPITNIDAACQVAHTISTHAVEREDDYYTAVDHLKPDDTAGAAMVGYIGFNSACYYRYARLDWRQLVTNLKSSREGEPTAEDIALARRTVEGFLRAWQAATPTGMKNSHDNNSRPSFMLGVVRTDGEGWSLANAFERPVRPLFMDGLKGGLIVPSVKALDTYWGWLCEVYGQSQFERVAALVLDPILLEDKETLAYLKPSLVTRRDDQPSNLEAWIEAMMGALPNSKEAA